MAWLLRKLSAMARLGRLLLVGAFAMTFVAGNALSRPAAPKRDCCGKSCPMPKAAGRACCRVAPAQEQAESPRLSAPVAHVAPAIAPMTVPREQRRQAPRAAVGPPDDTVLFPSGRSPPVVLA